MKRSLLPYEHQLIEALEVSEEDYLDFLAVTKDFAKSPEEVLEKPQATVAVASIVLTIVGIIFQVAGALLAPTPKEQQCSAAIESSVSAPALVSTVRKNLLNMATLSIWSIATLHRTSEEQCALALHWCGLP
jgi:hypothetical protein